MHGDDVTIDSYHFDGHFGGNFHGNFDGNDTPMSRR